MAPNWLAPFLRQLGSSRIWRNLRYREINCSTLPTELGRLSSIQDLYLSGNNFTGPIPEQLSRLTTLKNLDLGNNQFNESIPTKIGLLSRLTVLKLGQNLWTGTLCTELGNLSNLQSLWIEGNIYLRGTIPTELRRLTVLTDLLLQLNQ